MCQHVCARTSGSQFHEIPEGRWMASYLVTFGWGGLESKGYTHGDDDNPGLAGFPARIIY